MVHRSHVCMVPSFLGSLDQHDPTYILPVLCGLTMIAIFETQSRISGIEMGLAMRWLPRIGACVVPFFATNFPAVSISLIFALLIRVFASTGSFRVFSCSVSMVSSLILL